MRDPNEADHVLELLQSLALAAADRPQFNLDLHHHAQNTDDTDEETTGGLRGD